MLVIDPLICIDCGICEPECPADAIRSSSEAGLEAWVDLNARHAARWPNVTSKNAQLPDAGQWNGRTGKLALFSPQPGVGDR